MGVAGEGAIRGRCHHVVEEDARPDIETFPESVLERVEERHRRREVRAEAVEHQIPFRQRLPHQREIPLFQIAQPAMEELARPTGGARGVVALLDQGDRQATRSGIERYPASGDPTADDDNVECLLGHASEMVPPLGPVETRGALFLDPYHRLDEWCVEGWHTASRSRA